MTKENSCNWFENLCYVILSGNEVHSESKIDDINPMKWFVDLISNCGGYIP